MNEKELGWFSKEDSDNNLEKQIQDSVFQEN